MTNFNLPFVPERSEKPREKGLTMMMDKGLSLREVEDFIQSSGHLTDVVKFGFGTAVVIKKPTFVLISAELSSKFSTHAGCTKIICVSLTNTNWT